VDTTEIFGLRIARLAERIRRRREAPAAGAVFGEAIAQRLKLLAGLVVGRPLELRLVSETGGWSGEALLLPRVIDAFGTPALNEQAYVYRTVYAATSLRLGLSADAPSPLEARCRTLLAVAATRRGLIDGDGGLPAAADLEALLEPLLLSGRPLLTAIVNAAHICEALCQVRLGAVPERLPPPAPEARPWLEHALAFDQADSESIGAFADALFGALPPPSRWGRALPAPAPVVLWGELLPTVRTREDAAATPDAPAQAVTRQLDPKRTLGRIPRRPDLGRTMPPLFHHFEKIETLQDHDGDATRADESGDPESEQAALERMRPRQLIRTSQPSAACYRVDAMLDGVGLQVDDGDHGVRLHHYPEWHHRKRQYREAWCALQETTASAEPDAQAADRVRAVWTRHRRRIEAMRRRFEALLLERSIQRRQRDGPELDLDAAVDRHATLAAGHTPDDRLYSTQRRTQPDLAVYILLDQSLSSDSWIGGGAEAAGVRILDVERETVLLLGEVLDGLLDRVGIACFSSHTRNRCRFVRIKGLDEPWPPARARIMAIEPAGYTRIGPAIRHAAAKLARAPARRRLLLLVSDGRPTDYDQYEGRYGIKDVAQAVREAHAAGILSFALAVETGAETRLTEMFGRGHFRVLHHPRLLPEAVSEILLRLRA